MSGPAPPNRDSVLTSIVARDFDNDGHLDVLGLDNGTNGLHFFRGLGLGEFAADQVVSAGTSLNSYRVADLNGDGAVDLVVMADSQDALGVMLGRGDGTFQSYQQIASRPGAGYYHNDYAIGDLNDDGRPDIAVGDWNNSRLEVFLNDGSAPLVEPACGLPWNPSIRIPGRPVLNNRRW